MIRPSDRGDRRTNRAADGADRGQLLLVGAVAIALVFLGLVVVFNTVLFTDSTSPTEPLEAGEEARSFEEQVRKDTRMIMFQVASETGDTTCVTGFCADAEANISLYSLFMSTSYADTGPVYAAVEVQNVAGTATGLLSCASAKLCAEITVVYETDQFEYRDTIVVGVDPP